MVSQLLERVSSANCGADAGAFDAGAGADVQTPAEDVPTLMVESVFTTQPETLVDAPVAQVVALLSGGFVAADAEHVWIGGAEQPERLDAVVGALRGAYELAGELLVLGDDLHVRVGDALVASPLSEHTGEVHAATLVYGIICYESGAIFRSRTA